MSETTRPLTLDSMRREDLPEIMVIETLSFSEPWTEEMFLHELASEGLSHVLVARVDEGSETRIVGFLCAWIVAGELQINNVAVHPRYRRDGIASRLLQEIIRLGKTEGATVGYLEVRASNEAAKNLYHQHGFRLAGRRRDYYDHPREDAIMMRKELQ